MTSFREFNIFYDITIFDDRKHHVVTLKPGANIPTQKIATVIGVPRHDTHMVLIWRGIICGVVFFLERRYYVDMIYKCVGWDIIHFKVFVNTL